MSVAELPDAPDAPDAARVGAAPAGVSLPREQLPIMEPSPDLVDLMVLGGGRMGSALVGGIIAAGAVPQQSITVVDASERARAELRARFPGIRIVAAPSSASGHADASSDRHGVRPETGREWGSLGGVVGGRRCRAIVAVKPGDAQAACGALGGAGPERVLSIVAGVPSRLIERWTGDGVPVVRAMTNTPALVRCATTAIAAGAHAGQEDLAWAGSVMSALGVVVTVPEEMLDAVTGLSGSGPAYVFLVAEALISAGIASGLQPEVSRILASNTLSGAARMLLESEEAPAKLRDDVTSPGGTTASGLSVLEARGVREAFIDAVLAARDRSAEIGREAG